MILEWNEVKGFNENLNYRENIEEGANLPELGEEVLFYGENFDGTRDVLFNGYIRDDHFGVRLINLCDDAVEYHLLHDGLRWATFNKVFTRNNTEYAIAYMNEFGNDFIGDIPNIVRVKKSEIESKIDEFEKLGFSNITAFRYIKPCTFRYDWDYVKENEVTKEKYSFSDEERRILIIDEFAREDRHRELDNKNNYNYGLKLIRKYGFREVADDEAVQYYCKRNNLL